MNKKILSAIVCAAMVLSLTACGKNEDPLSGIYNSNNPASAANSTPVFSAQPEQSSAPAESSAPEESKPDETSEPSNVKTIDWSTVPVADELDFMVDEFRDGVCITQYLGTDTIINIPGTIDGKKVVMIGHSNRDPLFQRSNVTHIKVPEGVIGLQCSPFEGCESLESISLPNGLQYISGGTFVKCKALKSIEIPNTVTSIGDAFVGSGLESLTLPDSVKEIGGGIIAGLENLKEVTFPQNVTVCPYHDIEKYVDFSLSGCSSLTNTDFLKNVKTAEDVSLTVVINGCSSLTDITYPENVTDIDGFGGCENLTEITLPNTIKSASIGTGGCNNLKKITLPDSIENVNIGVDPTNENLEIVYKGKTYKPNQVPNLVKAINGN